MIARVDGYSLSTPEDLAAQDPPLDADLAEMLVTYQTFDLDNGPFDDDGNVLPTKTATVTFSYTDAQTTTRDQIEAAVRAAETGITDIQWLDLELPSEQPHS